MAIYRVLVAVLVAIAASPVSLGSDVAVRHISIASRWGGLGASQDTELSIENRGGVFYSGRKRIDSEAVASLVSALRGNAVDKPELTNLGITAEWLAANADLAVMKNNASFADALPEQKSLYRRSFTNLEIINSVVASLFNYAKFDDYPSVEVRVTFDDGSVISASSSSWYLMMLPWGVISGSTSIRSYNANISRAVAALMPDKATNRSRLRGEYVAEELAEATMRYIERDWKLIQVESKAGDALRALRTAYSIRSADINPYHDVAFGRKWDKGLTHEENLHATLTRPGFPPNFFDTAILLYQGGSVSGVEEFLRDAKQYEGLVLAVPWLTQLLAKYPKLGVSVLWIHDKSFSDKALNEFSADMHELGKDALIKEVRLLQKDAALLNVGYGDYWIVLPDKRMVLWRYTSVSGLLGLKQSQISTHECTDYHAVTGGCVGAVVSPEGELQVPLQH